PPAPPRPLPSFPTRRSSDLAFGRASGDGPIEAVTVVTRLAHGLAQRGGWGESWISLPPGRWRDLLGGAEVEGGQLAPSALLDDWPGALLVRAGGRGAARGASAPPPAPQD